MGMTIICLAITAGAFLVLHPEAKLFGFPIMNEPLSYSSLLAFFALLAGVSDPARKMSEVMGTLQRGVAAADRVFEILDCESKIVDPPHPKTVETPRPELVFDRVSFQYSTGQRVLHEVELRIPFGQTVAIVGPNGCGKTTLVNLLPRFYDVSAGGILIDGLDIRQATLASLRRQIGIVTQDTVLFDDTIASNIAYGTPDAPRAAIEAAARAANAHEFIVTSAHGYDTMIGERGQRLSGGQRQRLAIARALLKNAPILVLDEATSALDTESELLVQEALANLMMNRTSFVIAHRLSTIRRADAIIVLEQGRVVEIGRHDELLARPDGTYATLYQLQLLEGRKADRRMVTS
jgi:ABC-type multidrug transport system fused ATPase/permease subunit